MGPGADVAYTHRVRMRGPGSISNSFERGDRRSAVSSGATDTVRRGWAPVCTRLRCLCLSGVLLILAAPSGARAGQAPQPPMAPEVVARDVAGQATIRAVRLEAPLRIDGKLDEAVYQTVKSVSDFIQQEPAEGEPATEKTEVWVWSMPRISTCRRGTGTVIRSG